MKVGPSGHGWVFFLSLHSSCRQLHSHVVVGTEEEEEEEEEEEQRSCVLLSCCGSLILLTHSTSLSIEMKCSPGKKDPNAS